MTKSSKPGAKAAKVSVLDALRNAKPKRGPLSEMNGSALSKQSCPVCESVVTIEDINEHLDVCLAHGKKEAEVDRNTLYRSTLEVMPNDARRLEAPVSPSRAKDGAAEENLYEWKMSVPTKRKRAEQHAVELQNELTKKHETRAEREVSADQEEKSSQWTGVDLLAGTYGGAAEHEPYYLRAFRRVIDFTRKTHAHLYTETDMEVLIAFESLSIGGKKLLARIFKRKHRWLRQSDLTYDDIEGGVESATRELVKYGLLEELNGRGETEASVDNAIAVLPCLRAEKLRKLAEPFSQRSKVITKVAAEAIILNRMNNTRSRTISGLTASACMAIQVMKAAGHLVRLHKESLGVFELAHLVFFSVEDRNSPLLLLAELGWNKFPAYTCQVTRPIFPSRAALDHYLEARRIEEAFDKASMSVDIEQQTELGNHAEKILECYMRNVRGEVPPSAVQDQLNSKYVEAENKDCSQELPEGMQKYDDVVHITEEEMDQIRHPFLKRLTGLWVMAGVAWHSVALLERLKDHSGAVRRLQLILATKLTPHRHGKVLNRLTIDLKDHLGRELDALELCISGLQADEEWAIQRGERIQLAKRGRRLWQNCHKGLTIPEEFASLLRADTAVWLKLPQKMIFGRPLDEFRKEGSSSRFMGYDGNCVSVEELCLQSYKAEAEWDGAHCEDVFRTPFQDAPLDLGSEAFYLSRRQILRARLAEIESMNGDELETCTSDAWAVHEGTRCRGLNWQGAQIHAPQIARCIGGKTLAAAFLLLGIDYNYWSGGMPDLLLWRERDSAAMFVEVKGPRDSLMERQCAWLHELLASGARVEVCKVVERVTDRNKDLISGDHDAYELARLEN